MKTLTTLFTGRNKTVTSPVNLYTRPSKKQPGVLVVGVEFNGTRKRVALVRVNGDDTVKIRTLDGNPREASSKADTQSVREIPFDQLTDDE